MAITPGGTGTMDWATSKSIDAHNLLAALRRNFNGLPPENFKALVQLFFNQIENEIKKDPREPSFDNLPAAFDCHPHAFQTLKNFALIDR